MDQLHFFISLLLRGSVISKCSLKMSGKVREFDHDWRVANLLTLYGKCRPFCFYILEETADLAGMYSTCHSQCAGFKVCVGCVWKF